MIDVTVQDFLKLHGGLVRMLQAIAEAGPSGLPTIQAGKQVFNSRTYGWKMLVQAEKLGYITRTKAGRKGGGHFYVMNKLTDKGSKLLEKLTT